MVVCTIAGALPCLIAMLSSSQQTVQRAALEALAKLAWGNRQTCDAVMSAGRSMQSLERL